MSGFKVRTTEQEINIRKTNKLLAFSQRRVPYLPELKVVCGSVCASILMQQLEYWFANRPDGFYKFLEPCQHPQYKSQDSWTEELRFTLREFRGAFDKIGIRYRSKKQLQATLELGEDPFQGKFYLSYVEVRSGLTMYHRNHEVVDSMLVLLLNNYCPPTTPNSMQPANSNRNDVLSFPDMTKVHIQRCQNVISGSDNKSSLYKEHKTTTLDDTKKTAAIQTRSNENAFTTPQPPSSLAAAVKNKKERENQIIQGAVENLLGETLTSSQRDYVQGLLPEISQYFPDIDTNTLGAGITHTLCDPQAFTRAGSDFLKKLNTLQKAIRAGQWQVPVVLQDRIKKSKRQKRNMVHQQYREFMGEHAQLTDMLAILEQQGDTESSKKIAMQREHCQAHLKALRVELSKAEEGLA